MSNELFQNISWHCVSLVVYPVCSSNGLKFSLQLLKPGYLEYLNVNNNIVKQALASVSMPRLPLHNLLLSLNLSVKQEVGRVG